MQNKKITGEILMEMVKEKQKHMNDPINILIDMLKIELIKQGKLN